jgi:hypothetical protein
MKQNKKNAYKPIHDTSRKKIKIKKEISKHAFYWL